MLENIKIILGLEKNDYDNLIIFYIDKVTKRVKGYCNIEDLDKLEELAYYIKDNALCGLGQTAPNPVLSTLRYFRDEYVAHVVDKKCPAGVCKDLLTYVVDKDKCIGCGMCSHRGNGVW